MCQRSGEDLPLQRILWRVGRWFPSLSLIFLAFFSSACLDRVSLSRENPPLTGERRLLEEGKAALSRGDFSTALSKFTELDKAATSPEVHCLASYGLTLGHSLYWINVLNETVVKPIAALQGLNPQDIDLGETLRQYLGPLETPLRKLSELAGELVQKRCEFTLEGGLPIELGVEGKDLHFFVRIGYHFNEPVARVLLAFSNALLSGFDFILSHSFVISDMNQAVTYVTAAYNKMGESVRDAQGNVSQYTYITFARALGIIFAFNPDLLLFHKNPKEAQRFNRVDNELATLFRALYHQGSLGEEGLVPSLLEASRKVTDLTQEVLGVSDENRDGTLSAGDRLFIGVRALKIGHELALPDNRGGINVIIPPSLGDVDEVVRNLHALFQKLGDQFASVDLGESVTPPARIGLTEVNGVIRSVRVLSACLDPLPEAVEFDPRAYFFNNPQPLRRLLPYFTTSAGTFTPYEFLIEGESSRPVPDAYVYFRSSVSDTTTDFPHFPPAILFEEGGTVNNLSIPADNLFPPPEISQPLPYVAWQDPTFHGVLYVNPALLPLGREGTNSFIPPTQYLTNKATVAYLLWLADHLNCAG